MSDDDFFDDPTKKRSHKLVLSSEDVAQLNELMVQFYKEHIAPEAAHQQYVARLQKLLQDQGTSLQQALADNPDFPYLRAGRDARQFMGLVKQAAAAAACADEADESHAWDPPPEDAEPETAEDYA